MPYREDRGDAKSSAGEEPLTASRMVRIVGAYVRPHSLALAGFFASMLLSAGALLLLPRLMATAIVQGAQRHEWRVIVVIFGLGLVWTLAGALRNFLITWVGERVVADLRTAVFRHVLGLSPAFFEKRRTGDIISRLLTDVALLKTAVTAALPYAPRSIVMLLGSLVVMFVMDPPMTLLVVLLVPFLVLLWRSVGKEIRRLARETQDRLADLGAVVEESINGIRTVQSYQSESRVGAIYENLVRSGLQLTYRRLRLGMGMSVATGVIVFLLIAGMLRLGFHQIHSGMLTTAQLTAFLFYAFFAAISSASLSEAWSFLQRGVGAGERVLALLNAVNPIQEPQDPAPLPAGKGQVEFRQVEFHYPTRPRHYAIQRLNCTIVAGQHVALVGPSGAGKSTLFHLLLRFYDPQAGEILLEGVPLTRLSMQELRSAFAVVSQEPVIFSASARENILLGRPSATETEVMEAAQAAHAWEFLRTLPEGLDTQLGERGITLSGGQRQRIAIARALLKDPRILLLDEATSALDSESEHLVQSALTRLGKNRTTVTIAHRLSTVRHADWILVLNDGRIVGQGKHDDLLGDCPIYARLAKHQFLTDTKAL
ncbi:ABC transporter ATP-binding protein [Acidithiobacillus sulfuriphilus]|uniref:ABC transporter ATP-binding protein n=1 Tax=Acidithiobacillus sulfuriphilus TaxID=1867749 RepID=UPI003F6459D0